MRTFERLTKLKNFVYEELCRGREYKCPTPATGQQGKYGPDIKDFGRAEPRVFLAWQPVSPGEAGLADPSDLYSICPAITIMPMPANVRNVPKKAPESIAAGRRLQDMGQTLAVQLLFGIYEPGERWPGFVESLEAGKPDMDLLQDGTEPGLMTLMDWMDDATALFLREKSVPHTDLMLDDDSMVSGLYSQQGFIVDRRPIFYGYLSLEFKCHADTGTEHGRKGRIDRLLDGDI